PSFAEGLPMVIMEAFAVGRPVLTTYVAGIPELVVDGYNGWLVPSGSVEAITRGIERVMSTPLERLEVMAERGREAVRREHYTLTEVRKLARCIEEAVTGRGPSRPPPRPTVTASSPDAVGWAADHAS